MFLKNILKAVCERGLCISSVFLIIAEFVLDFWKLKTSR